MRAVAVHRALHQEIASAAVRLDHAPRVLDVGGGSGGWAVPLAAAGCFVTVVDTSPNALATLHRRAAEAGVSARVTPVQGDAEQLLDVVGPGSADLVLGHGLLEVVEDPTTVTGTLAQATAPGGAVSVVVANRDAAVLGRALAGRVDDARAILTGPDGRVGRHDPLLRRFDTPGLADLLTAAGLTVELVQGDGVLGDKVLGDGVLGDSGQPTPGEDRAAPVDRLVELELLAAGRPALRDVATRLHAIARRAR